VPAIVWAGLVSGVLDLGAAFNRWVYPVRNTRAIASGLLGPKAYDGGWELSCWERRYTS
jgi:hypothetical protein